MMTRRAKKGRDDMKTSLLLPRALMRAVRIRAAMDEMQLREVFIRALNAYLRNRRKEER